MTLPPEHEKLRERFAVEPMFMTILDALLELDHDKNTQDRSRAQHRAKEYMIDDGKLWRIADSRMSRAHAQLECVTQVKMVELARVQHETSSHYMWDMVKIALLDKYSGSRVDQAIVKGINNCR
jgi:hypothetical protein